MTITKEDVADAMRDWCAAVNARDVKTAWAMEAGSGGFGYRSAPWRNQEAGTEAPYVAGLQQFYDQLFDYRLELEDLQASVDGDLGLAWGTYIERFQQKGHSPERALVRFSQVMRKEDSGWKVVMFHRDIQPFDGDGRYPRALTAV